ncbi:MAG TPA: type IV toxin-antitoxin system AbiEi family antitoxin domain-containing protein [Acidimicrobiia bacterium]|nr:type IV toxin-antitoxin system AbiEi family antitoxin domain-containing protein [Acidimicrobiia bacterium]
MEADRRLDDYAAHQYGVFSRKQAKAVGLSPRMIQTRVETGAWIRLAPSVYALASAPPKWERQVAAALLTKEGAIVAGRSAAHLLDFPGFVASKPVIMIGLDGNARSPLARVIRSRRFESIGTVRRRGFTSTNEAETVMTLARDLDEAVIEPLVDALLARKSLSVAELIDVVRVSDDVPGVPKLRRVVEYRAPSAYQPPTSELERLLYRLLGDPRLPDHTRQMPMSYQQVDATVDAYIDRWRLIVEGDGRRWHTRRADMARDRLRDNEATAHGHAVLRFTYEQLRDEPAMCLDTLLRTGRVRQAS